MDRYESEPKKPKHRRVEVYVRRQFGFDGPLEKIPKQHWHEPINPFLKKIA